MSTAGHGLLLKTAQRLVLEAVQTLVMTGPRQHRAASVAVASSETAATTIGQRNRAGAQSMHAVRSRA